MTENQKYRAAARLMYARDNCQIDDNAKVSVADTGAWVQAWVWVPEKEKEAQR